MESTTDIRRIHTVNNYLKDYFGHKVIKLSLDGGFTCPNRDGLKGYDGCAFCSSSGSGEMSSTIQAINEFEKSLDQQIELLSPKWANANGYIAYFQNHTNTYAPLENLKALFNKALESDRIIGIAIATRPDCLDDEIISYLSDLNKKTFLWVELGLQSYDDNTAKYINRQCTTAQYEESVIKLLKENIRVVTHLILGLPGETPDMMRKSVKEVSKTYDGKRVFGMKLHMLNIVKGSTFSETIPCYNSFASINSYTDFVTELLTYIPWEITIHRLTADVPRKLLISPPWSFNKLTILNQITHKMRYRNLIQGDNSY